MNYKEKCIRRITDGEKVTKEQLKIIKDSIGYSTAELGDELESLEVAVKVELKKLIDYLLRKIGIVNKSKYMKLLFHNDQGACIEYIKNNKNIKYCDKIEEGEYVVIENEKYYLNDYKTVTKGTPIIKE